MHNGELFVVAKTKRDNIFSLLKIVQANTKTTETWLRLCWAVGFDSDVFRIDFQAKLLTKEAEFCM